MTGGAAHALGDVNAVIEIDEVRHGVDARPGNRLGIAVAGANRFEHGGVGPNLGVAGHASLGRRHSGGGRNFHRGVAVAAIQAQFADVMLVAERHRLRTRDVHLGHVGRLVDDVHGVT